MAARNWTPEQRRAARTGCAKATQLAREFDRSVKPADREGIYARCLMLILGQTIPFDERGVPRIGNSNAPASPETGLPSPETGLVGRLNFVCAGTAGRLLPVCRFDRQLWWSGSGQRISAQGPAGRC